VVLNIDKNKGIKEISRITHIKTDSLENQRTEECKKYSDKVAEPCKTLIG
jgi:hypothetical protein